MKPVDILAVVAHPDDAEISVGGTLLLAKKRGLRTAIIDATRGEMGTRGSREVRDREAEAASRVLELHERCNLELPDGRVQVTLEAREHLARLLRDLRPTVVLTHTVDDLHPDHAAVGRLCREAWYLSGLNRLAEESGGSPARRPPRLYHFLSHVNFRPTFVVDIGEVWEQKRELVRCFASQLEPASGEDKGDHFLFGADILTRMETKARFHGESIGVAVGEPLLHLGPLPFGDTLLDLEPGEG